MPSLTTSAINSCTRLKPWVNRAVTQALPSLFTLILTLYRIAASHMTFLYAVLDLPFFVCLLAKFELKLAFTSKPVNGM